MNQKLTFCLRAICVPALCLFFHISHAQVFTQTIDVNTFDSRARYKAYEQIIIPIKEMPSVDVEALIAEDRERAESPAKADNYFRFGKEIAVSLGLENAGKWAQLENGDRIWLLKILSKGAYSINLEFNKFYIPEGGELYIYNGDKTMLQGPITFAQNMESGVYANDLLKGESIILEYYEPSSATGKSQLNISQVIHGYVDTFSSSCWGFGCSQPCNQTNNDVKCSIGSNWQTESNGVALVLKGGLNRSTGFLINNTNQDKKPYFLLSQHQIPDTELETAIFRFYYKSPTCNGGDGPTTYSVTGADKITEKNASDLKLLLLRQNPSFSGKPVSYLGWSILATTPSATTTIHHPHMDVMKIATAGAASRYVKPSDGKNVWRYYFNDGITEQGSSGAPTFDQNKRVVGLIHGSASSLNCSNYSTVYGYSGRLDTAWDSLCVFLDPGNWGAVTLNTLVSSPVAKTVPSISGPNTICSSDENEILNNAPYGVTWSVSPASLVAVSSGTGSTATIRAKNSSSSGTATLSFKIPGACKTYSKSIKIGPYNNSNIVISGPSETCVNTLNIFGANELTGATDWNWTSPPGWTLYSGGDGYDQIWLVSPPYTTSTTAIELRVKNQCGWSPIPAETHFIIVNCLGYSGFVIQPNPASDYIEVEAVSEKNTATLPAKEIEYPTYNVKLYDEQQRLVKWAESNKNSPKTRLEITDVKPGHYYVHIEIEDEIVKQHVFIE